MGRWTLTTTVSPVIRIAAWTWAIEAAASGTVENALNTWSRGSPKSSSTIAFTLSKDSAGTWSRSSLNSATRGSGKIPWPDDRIWPNFM